MALPCFLWLEEDGSLLVRACYSVPEASSDLYPLARKCKGYDSSCSQCATCAVHIPPRPLFQWAPKNKNDFWLPVPVSPSPRTLPGTKHSSLPGINNPSPSSLQPMTDWSWCLTTRVHPPSGRLVLRRCPTPFPRFNSSHSL